MAQSFGCSILLLATFLSLLVFFLSLATTAFSQRYATFALFSLVAPAINAKLGAKGTLLLGTVGYTLFVVALYCFRSEVAGGTFVVAAAAVNGISAALLWTAQGQLTLAYPTREVKGMFFAMFWVMFNVRNAFHSFLFSFSFFKKQKYLLFQTLVRKLISVLTRGTPS